MHAFVVLDSVTCRYELIMAHEISRELYDLMNPCFSAEAMSLQPMRPVLPLPPQYVPTRAAHFQWEIFSHQPRTRCGELGSVRTKGLESGLQGVKPSHVCFRNSPVRIETLDIPMKHFGISVRSNKRLGKHFGPNTSPMFKHFAQFDTV